MAMNFKKHFQRKMTYIPKDIATKHKHNYVEHFILEITNKNIHATANCYNTKEYYEVLKCDNCDSFIPNSKDGNFSGIIFDDNYNKEIPLITANTNMKGPAYNFDNLYDIVIKKK